MAGRWRRWLGGTLSTCFLGLACSGIANDPSDDEQVGAGPADGGSAATEGGAPGILIEPLAGGPSLVPPEVAAGGGACESPGPVACAELDYGPFIEASSGGAGGASAAGGASGASGVDIGLGAGDLTLLVIFDKSGSMDSPWDLRNRWQAASDSMIAGMAPYLDNLTIGAILFPKPDACEVAPLDDISQINFVPGRQFVAEWVESACLNQPNGSTPMGLAFTMADQALVSANQLGLLEDRFRVVLVTDGEPNCENQVEQLLPAFAAAWYRDLGVETWVIGLPGSDGAAALLDSIALAGGTTKHTPAGNPCEFQQAVGAAAK
jgi:hypothetical protein